MIYLIKQPAYDENGNYIDILKIGFTESIKIRKKQYLSGCPSTVFLQTREGDEFLESFLHIYFSEYKYPKLREWFYYSEEIIRDFSKISFTKEYCDKITNTLGLIKLLKMERYSMYLEQYAAFEKKSLKDFKKEIKRAEIKTYESLQELLSNLILFERFEMRLKILSKFIKSHPEDISNLPDEYRFYFENLTIEKMRISGFKKDKLDSKIKRLQRKDISLLENEELSRQVYKDLVVGEFYSRKNLKTYFTDVFQRLGIITPSPKASCVCDFFETLTTQQVDTKNKTYEGGFKLLKRKN